jgi:hypothetical protein
MVMHIFSARESHTAFLSVAASKKNVVEKGNRNKILQLV